MTLINVYKLIQYNIYLVIDIDVIMSFNKIKLMTNNKLLFIEAVKDLECIELNSEQTKIRKRQK